MNDVVISPDQRAKLLNHISFGNPAGRFWFVGMEEAATSDPDELARELLIRATEVSDIDDLIRVSDVFREHGYPGEMTTLIPTWHTMCKLAMRLDRRVDWADTQSARIFQSTHIGRTGGETFLVEVFPLPKPGVGHWPSVYEQWFRSREAYYAEVLPQRIQLLRTLFDRHRPEFVFCYGKAFWEFHKAIFHDVTFSPILDGKIEMGRFNESRIILTPFFAYWLMTNPMIELLATELERKATA